MLLLMMLESIILVTALMIIAFIIAQYKHNTTVVDIAWGIGFLLVAVVTFLKSGLYLPRHVLASALVCIWALRITTHLYLRIRGKEEDARYKNFRRAWGASFAVRSFFQLFMLQAFLLLIIAYPIMVINSSTEAGLGALDLIGLLVWIVGFAFEAVGDYQLKQFVNNPHNKNKVMESGLWRYTRHPNYFGEITMWWGIFIIALSVPYGITAIVSPITITFLLVCVSGIPITEKLFDTLPAYQEYKKRTSALLPWLPKKK